MNEELEFILRMRDEATAALKKFGVEVDGSGNKAKKFSRENDEAAKSLDNLTKKARDAAKAITSAFATMRGARAGLAAFNSYEQGMLNVQKTTNMTQKEMVAFQQTFDEMAGRLTGIDVGNMLGIAGIAGQLGVAKDQIASFTEVMAKLEVATDIFGEEGATNMARFLTLSGEGVERVREMGAVLVGLGNTVKARESEILKMGMTLAQATQQFKLGGAALMGIGAAAAELNFRPELFSTAVQRTLIQLSDAAQYGGKGMQMLSAITGMTQEQFRELIRNNPTEALFQFLDVLNAMQGSGQSLTGFLTAFNLQSMETIRVLGTAAEKVDDFRKHVAAANQELASPVALDKEYENFAQGLVQQWTGLKTEFTLLGKDMVGAIADPLKDLVGIARTVVGGIRSMFNSLPEGLKPWVTTAVALGGAFKGVVMVLKLIAPALAEAFALSRLTGFLGNLGTLGTVLRMLLNPIKALQLAFAFMAGFAQGVIGELILAFGGIPVAVGVAIAAIAGIGIALWRNWDSVKAFFSQSWSEIGSQIVEAVVNGFKRAMARARQLWTDFWEWATRQTIEQRAFDANQGSQGTFKRMLDGMKKAIDEAASKPVEVPVKLRGSIDSDIVRDISPEQRQLIESLDSITKAREEVRLLEEAVEALAALPKNSMFAVSDEELARLRAQVELRKRELDPVKERMRLLQIEIEEAGAITAERRNELEIEREIRDLEEEIGVLTAERREELTALIRQLQETHRQTALGDWKRDLREQLDAATAITQAEKDRIAILREINAFERENGELLEHERKEIEALLGAIKQAQAWSSLEAALDPQGAAVRKYADDLAVLDRQLQQGAITQERYNQLKAQLERQTLAQRDPFAAEMKSLREQMDLLRINGDYRDADRRTQETVNRLMEQGVQITKEQVAQLQAANRELQDMEKAQNSGLQGWMNSVGTLRDNLLDMTKDFASGLSDAIAGVLEGKRGGFTALLRRLASNMISIGVNQTLKQLLAGAQTAQGGLGNFFRQAFGVTASSPVNAANDVGKSVAEAVSNMATATMNVTAASVFINGVPVGSGAIPGINEGFGGAPVGEVTRQALEPIKTSAGNVAEALDTSGWELRTSIDNVAGNIDKAIPGLRGTISDLGNTVKTAGREVMDMTRAIPAPSDLPNLSGTSGFGKVISLTPKEIKDLKKTLATEWVTSAGEMQGKGIIDTILNRKASGKWGPTITDVVNARAQFSDINSILTDKKGRNSVDQLSDAILNTKKGRMSSDLVDRWLAERAAGAKSVVGDHLNYANPYFSSKKNLPWINALEGPVFGKGNAIHRHGTVPELQKFRPGEYGIQLPGQQAMGVANPQIQQLTNQWTQQMQVANQNIAQQMPQAFQQPMQNVGQQFAQTFQQGSSALQQIGPQFQQISQSAQMVVPNLGGLSSGLTQMTGALAQAPAMTGQFTQALMQMMQQMATQQAFGLFGGLFHKGGTVGAGHPASGYRLVPADTWRGAVKHHNGLKGVEYPAILKRGEKVLTANDNRRTQAVIEGLSDRLEQINKAAASNRQNRRFGNQNFNQNITVYAQDADSFRRSEAQLMTDSSVKMRRMAGRNS